MLESDLRDLFARQAADDPQALPISIEAASRIGRSRLRWRRASAVGTPFLAAGAVLAVVLASAAVPATHTAARHARILHRPAATAAPRYFNPLRQYASFGWLPPGYVVFAVSSTRTVEYMSAGNHSDPPWQVGIYADGQCSLAHAKLTCATLTPLQEPVATGRAPDIDGRAAYWVGSNMLMFQYAPGGWATIVFHRLANVIRVAEHLTFGGPAPAVRFPTQLTGGQAGWTVGWVLDDPGAHGRLAFQYVLARGAPIRTNLEGVSAQNVPLLTVAKASPDRPCYFTPGASVRTEVGGHQVVVTRIAAGREPAEQDLCAADADGLSVDIGIAGDHPVMDVTDFFARLRLLGPDPANWTTRPAG
jgi:hypothetical protein